MTEEKDRLADLTRQFEASRSQLRAMAYRMLGSQTEADDALQEGWLRISRAETEQVENLRGFLTTVIARICLDMLRSRKARREDTEDNADEASGSGRDVASPERDSLLVDSLGIALLVVLESLSPTERLAFVLHDLFDLPFEEIAPIVGGTPASARKLASRARQRVRGGGADAEEPKREQQRQIVSAFMAASRNGDMSALLSLLDPQVVMRCDPLSVAQSVARAAHGAPILAPETHGAAPVAAAFSGRARAARLVLIDGRPGAAWAPQGRPRAVISFDIVGDKVVGIGFVAEPSSIESLAVVFLDEPLAQPDSGKLSS